MGALKMGFNLNDYEDVATLNKWFISNFPKGRSDLSVISHDAKDGYILVQATLWRDAVDAVGHTTPKEPPMCEHGMILKQGVSKGGKPYYGYVCKGSNKDHAVWAKMTAKGTFYFDGVE
jgi:hypothetical protein